MKTQNLREQLNQELGEIRKVYDELRLQVHLGTLETKSRLRELEPKVREMEQRLNQAGETMLESTKRFATELKTDLVQLAKQATEQVQKH